MRLNLIILNDNIKYRTSCKLKRENPQNYGVWSCVTEHVAGCAEPSAVSGEPQRSLRGAPLTPGPTSWTDFIEACAN
jgi:hypothetical protein